MEETLNEIDKIFDTARNKDEFKFLLTVLNYKHIANQEESSNLYEWFDAIEFYKDLYAKHTSKDKLRVGLLLYSTFFENSDFYNILGSLCRNAMGYSGSSYLFWKTKKQERLLGTGEKIRMVTELLSDCSYDHVISFFAEVHHEQIRNTFFHSAYGISEGQYILFDSEAISLKGVFTNRIDIDSILIPLIDNVILFFDRFRKNYLESFSRYKEEITIKGGFTEVKNVIIHGTPEGLKGVTVKNTAQFYGKWVDSAILYDEKFKFWYGRNIQFTPPQIERIEIDESISRFELKPDIKTNDSEFFNLVDKVTERNLADEMKRIINLLLKFGDNKYSKWAAEQNDHKKKSIKKLPIVFYERAVQLNKHLNLSTTIARLKELES